MGKRRCSHAVKNVGNETDGTCNNLEVLKYSSSYKPRCRLHYYKEAAEKTIRIIKEEPEYMEHCGLGDYEVPEDFSIPKGAKCCACVADANSDPSPDGSCNKPASKKWSKEYYRYFGEEVWTCRLHFYIAMHDINHGPHGWDGKLEPELVFDCCPDEYYEDEYYEPEDDGYDDYPLDGTSDHDSWVGGTSSGSSSASAQGSQSPSAGGGSGNSAPNSPSDDEPPDPQDYARRGEPMPQDPLDPDLCPGRGYKDSHSFISCDNSSGYGCWGGLYNYGQGFCWYCGIPA